MTTPLTVSVPHRLGKDEAVRRLKGGMSQMATKLDALITIEQEVWEGDTLTFQMRGFEERFVTKEFGLDRADARHQAGPLV
jgi:hypothetical protein